MKDDRPAGGAPDDRAKTSGRPDATSGGHREDTGTTAPRPRAAEGPEKPRVSKGTTGGTAASVRFFQIQRKVENALSQRISQPVIAKALGISTRQVRRYAAAIRKRWAEEDQGSYLSEALIRLREDATNARQAGGPRGIAVAIQAERLAADLLGLRTGLSRGADHDPYAGDDEESEARLIEDARMLIDIGLQLAEPREVVVRGAEPEAQPVTVTVEAQEVEAVHVDAMPVTERAPAPSTVETLEERVERVTTTETVTTTMEKTETRAKTVRSASGRYNVDPRTGWSSPGQRRAYQRARSLPRDDDD